VRPFKDLQPRRVASTPAVTVAQPLLGGRHA